MSAQIIDGKIIAEQITREVAEEVKLLKSKGVQPGLAVVIVGERPDSQLYVRKKAEMSEQLGIYSEKVVLPATTSQTELLAVVDRLNKDPKIHGILVQSPPPDHIDEAKIIDAINPAKDVDGFHAVNVGKMTIGDSSALVPCTPAGCVELLIRSGVKLEGANVVVLGRSMIVGKPAALLLMANDKRTNATVTVCHSRTKNMAEIMKQADVLVIAIGKPEFVKADMVRDGAVVIDVGIHVVPDPSRKSGKRTTGDVDFAAVSAKASMITPVPGGVGPMTIAMLMKNTVKAARQIHNIS